MVLAHIQITEDASLPLSQHCLCKKKKTLFIIHVYHHTMSTVCYQFHGWTGSNLELLHETRLYRQHWNGSHLALHSQPHWCVLTEKGTCTHFFFFFLPPNCHCNHPHTKQSDANTHTSVLGNACQFTIWVCVYPQHHGLLILTHSYQSAQRREEEWE